MLHNEYDHIILLAHGSPDPLWKQPFEALHAQTVEQYGAEHTSLAFMELTSPTLEEVVEALDKDIKSVAVLPLFFAVGRHLRLDVPAQIEALQNAHLKIDLLAPIGDDPLVQQAMQKAIAGHLGKNQ